jgi:hypothetical protein
MNNTCQTQNNAYSRIQQREMAIFLPRCKKYDVNSPLGSWLIYCLLKFSGATSFDVKITLPGRCYQVFMFSVGYKLATGSESIWKWQFWDLSED